MIHLTCRRSNCGVRKGRQRQERGERPQHPPMLRIRGYEETKQQRGENTTMRGGRNRVPRSSSWTAFLGAFLGAFPCDQRRSRASEKQENREILKQPCASIALHISALGLSSSLVQLIITPRNWRRQPRSGETYSSRHRDLHLARRNNPQPRKLRERSNARRSFQLANANAKAAG
jgi:hypothetical protein